MSYNANLTVALFVLYLVALLIFFFISKITILQGAKMVEKFYMERVLPQINLTEEYFWERKMLEYRDWRGEVI